MSRQTPAEGTHPAKLPEGIVVYVTDAGALCAAVPVELLSEIPWIGKTTVTLVNKDNVTMENNIKNLRRAFSWETADFFDLESAPVGTEFDAVGGTEDYDPDNTGSPIKAWKVKWINPKGAATKMPERIAPADRKSVLTKFGGKFKALLGSTGGKTEAKPAKAAPVEDPVAQPELAAPAPVAAPAAPAPVAKPKAAVGGPPSRKPAPVAPARQSTLEEVWTALDAAANGKTQEELSELFWTAVAKVKPTDTDGSSLAPEDWGKVATELGV